MRNSDDMSSHKTVIVCESTPSGTDKRLLDALIHRHSLLPAESFTIKTVSPTGSLGDVMGFLTATLKNQPYIVSQETKTVLVIVDADEEPLARYREIKACFDTQIFAVQSSIDSPLPTDLDKIHVGIYLFPDRQHAGSLETLGIKTLSHQALTNKLDCIDRYMGCIDRLDGPMTANNISKSKLRICMATPEPDRYVDSIIDHIDFDSPEFDLLKTFIQQAN